ncbi:MAG TPA: glycosyltransferase family 39 protein [Opitutaceae bacterium]|jgi:hypothetical protein|nr:glycosyltransferase family 39 protein [Opitutaceae bacterium]
MEAVAKSSRKILLVAAVLLAGYFIMAVSASREKGPAFDETDHLAAGYNAWLNHDFCLDPGNGDFVRRWATLPLLFSKPAFPPLSDSNWRNAQSFGVGHEFLFSLGNDPASILLPCRCMVALLGVVLGALIFACSRKLFGDLGGIFSLGLFVFCPHMLAYGALVTTDLAFALALLASTWFIWLLLHRVTWAGLMGSLLAFSLLLISKVSAVLIAPIAVVLIVARCFNREPWVWRLGKERILASRRQQISVLAGLILIHAVVGWATIWAAYDFRYSGRADAADSALVFKRLLATDTPVQGPLATTFAFCRRTHLLPEGYLFGAEDLAISKRRASFMAGRWNVGGSAWFFPYVVWAKTPSALFFLLPFGLAGWWWARPRKSPPGRSAASAKADRVLHNSKRATEEAIPFITLFVVYAAVAIWENLNIGFRHILVLYPVLYIFAGSVALWWPLSRLWARAVTVLLVGWFAVDSLSVRPHYLAYFNSFVGGPAQGYQHLVDSSLDWGQDLPGLKRWLTTHNPGDGEPVFLSYFGTASPEYYGIKSERLLAFPEWRRRQVFACTPGYYAISATMFQNVYTEAFGPWNRAYENAYQTTLQNLDLSEPTAGDSATLGAWLQQQPGQSWPEQYGALEALRFNRLCGWLRATHRPPDAEVGYSILIWKLDAQDLHDALWGPPLELYDAPAN